MFVAVVVVCFWRSSWLAFLILTYYIKLMHQFLTPLSYLLWRLSYRSYRIFWKRLFAKNNFWVFLSVPHLLDNYAKIVDGRGRNFMCHRTLPSRLVCYMILLWFSRISDMILTCSPRILDVHNFFWLYMASIISMALDMDAKRPWILIFLVTWKVPKNWVNCVFWLSDQFTQFLTIFQDLWALRLRPPPHHRKEID